MQTDLSLLVHQLSRLDEFLFVPGCSRLGLLLFAVAAATLGFPPLLKGAAYPSLALLALDHAASGSFVLLKGVAYSGSSLFLLSAMTLELSLPLQCLSRIGFFLPVSGLASLGSSLLAADTAHPDPLLLLRGLS